MLKFSIRDTPQVCAENRMRKHFFGLLVSIFILFFHVMQASVETRFIYFFQTYVLGTGSYIEMRLRPSSVAKVRFVLG